MEGYDEDLSENPYFIRLQSQHPQLYETATGSRWILCVPRRANITSASSLRESDFLNHILIPTATDDCTLKTLSDKVVSVQANIIVTGIGFSEKRNVPILFEETYYNKQDESFKVLCINQMLDGDVVADAPVVDSLSVTIQSLEDCVDLLWGHTSNRRSSKQLAHLIDLFNKTCLRLTGEPFHHQVDAANMLFTRGMQTVLKDKHLRKTAKSSQNFMDGVKLAVETYVLHGVYRKLFKNVTTCLSTKDSKLNKITRNLEDLQLKDLGVRREFGENIPRARQELSNLNRYSTPLGKLSCVRRMIKFLMSHRRSSTTSNGSNLTLTTDDLLPILVFLIIKAEIANWWANFYYMTNFRFSKSSNHDEFGFYLASVEAALEHVSRKQVTASSLERAATLIPTLANSGSTGSIWSRPEADADKTEKLFKFVTENNSDGVGTLLSEKPISLKDIQGDLCHPLCSCPDCWQKVSRTQVDPSSVSAYSRDDRGYTVLHVAALHGFTQMTELLIHKGAIVNATDYQGLTPLHVACQRGHQAVVLLLLHYKASVNLQDTDGNTPMHLATIHGHEECVKALVYYDQGSTQLNMNLGNDFGDTALHLAAKWGYESLVEILLENGARADVYNRRRQSPLHMAHNLRVAQRLNKVMEEVRLMTLQRGRTKSLPRRSVGSAIPPSPTMPELSYNSHTTTVSVGVKPPTPVSGVKSPTLVSDISASSCPNLAWVAAATRARRRSEVPLSAADKKVEKLLKCVADGDVPMVRFHLGWGEEEEEEEIPEHNLCHPLCQCKKCRPLQKFTMVSPEGVHINCSNHDGYTPLHIASLHGHVALIKMFLKRGANVNARTKKHSCTPLHLACQNNRLRVREVVDLLVTHGAKINQRDSVGSTPLHFCCLNGNKAAAEVLLASGCSVNVVNQKGNTPLHDAARWSSLVLVELLIKHDADVMLRNRQCLMPTQLTENTKIHAVLKAAQPRQAQAQPADDTDGTAENLAANDSAIHDVFADFEEEDLQLLHNVKQSIQAFDRKKSLRKTQSFDRSAPQLNTPFLLHWSIENFDRSFLRQVSVRGDEMFDTHYLADDQSSESSTCDTIAVEDIDEDAPSPSPSSSSPSQDAGPMAPTSVNSTPRRAIQDLAPPTVSTSHPPTPTSSHSSSASPAVLPITPDKEHNSPVARATIKGLSGMPIAVLYQRQSSEEEEDIFEEFAAQGKLIYLPSIHVIEEEATL